MSELPQPSSQPHAHVQLAPTVGRDKRGTIVSGALLGAVAFACGLGLKAYAEAPTGLRGLAGELSMNAPAASNTTPQSFLSDGIWRAGPCTAQENFQAFRFGAASSVEVGSGAPGDGERLELLKVSEANGLVAVETRVCAPVGCNQTFEQYKRLDANRIQEWHFEGRLPNEAPYVLVANGKATDGSTGRVFQRCSR